MYDVERQQRVTFIEKPQECPPLEVARCCLFWESDATLLVGWGDTIKASKGEVSRFNMAFSRHGSVFVLLSGIQVLEIKRGVSQVNGTISSASQSRYGELVAIFQMDFIVTGISAWDAFSIAVLGYVTPETVDVVRIETGLLFFLLLMDIDLFLFRMTEERKLAKGSLSKYLCRSSI